MHLVEVERHKRGIVRVVMNDAEARNAMGVRLRGALTEVLSDLFADATARVIVIASALPNFSVGGDLSKMDALTDPKAGRARMMAAHPLARMILAAEKPLIAEVEGHAFGAGAGLALACDTIVMGQGAALGFGFFRVGLVPDFAIAHTLPRRIGFGRAREALMYGRSVSGEEAAAIGLADDVVPDGGAAEAAMARAERLARQPSLAMGLTKRMLERHESAEAVMDFEAAAQPLCFASPDFAEGLAAFREKRGPRFDPESE